MCGIVGFLGQRQVKEHLLQGLRKLEYRGYESAGLVVMTANGEISTAKAATGVESLHDLCLKVEKKEMPERASLRARADDMTAVVLRIPS